MKFLILFTILCTSFTALAISEKNYAQQFKTEIQPYFNQNFNEQRFMSFDGVQLKFAYSMSPDAIGNLIILPGYDESYLKYQEIAYDLKDLNYNIFILDHRGQGLSDHLLPNTQKPYVDKYQDYISDLKLFILSQVLPRSNDLPLFMLAHSMGSAIGTLVLDEYQQFFKKAVLCSPMYRLNTKPYPESIAYGIVASNVKLGNGENYAIGKGPYNEKDLFINNTVSHSEPRWLMNREMQTVYPQIRLGGPTNQWVYENMKMTYQIDDIIRKIQVPVLMLSSDIDLWVRKKFQPRYCNKMKYCTIVSYPGSFHELLMEKDDIRNDVISKIKNFLQ